MSARSGTTWALENDVRACLGPPARSKMALGPARGPPGRSKVLLERAFEATVRSDVLLERFFEAAVRSKSRFGGALLFAITFRSCCSKLLFEVAGLCNAY